MYEAAAPRSRDQVEGLVSGIFISYRRADSDVAAGRLADDLSGAFGPSSIFRDVDQLYPGVDYQVAIDSALDSCLVLLAIIGPQWSTVVDQQGRRRLEDPHDWVRAEIARALTRNVRVIPVLMSGAPMPEEGQLPAELTPLLRRQGCDLDDRHWRQDLEILIGAIENIPGIPKRLAPAGPTPTATGTLKLIGSKQRFPLIKPLMTIHVDDKEVGRMKVSDDFSLELPPGTHNMFLTAPLWLTSSNTTTLEVQPGQTCAFVVTYSMGTLKVEASG